MLLIWDNVESVFSLPEPGGATPPLSDEQRAEIAAFLAAFRSEGFGSALIITSRMDEPWLGDVRRVELEGLLPQEAAEYADDLLAAYPRAQAQRQEKAFGALMEWLNGHPLSLKLILPQLEESSAAALLAGLQGMGTLPDGFDAAGRLRSLGASVKYSLDHLPEEVCRLLPALALFEGVAAENVLAVFSQAANVPARFAGASKESWQAALAETARVGLLTPLGVGEYGVLPALPAYLAAQWRREAGQGFEEERQAAQRALLTAYADFGEWLNQQIGTGSAEGALALVERQRRTMGQLLAFGLDEGRYAETQAILQPLNEFWKARGLAEEAKGWVDRVRRAVEGAGGAAPDFASAAGALWLFAVSSEANRAIGSHDLAGAERAYEDIRRTLEAVQPAGSRGRRLAIVYHQLGRVAQERGDLATAEEWYRKSLAIFEALGDRPGMARSYHELGRVAQNRGDLAAAEEWYRKSLAIEEALGDRPGMATSYGQLGLLAEARGDLASALDWMVQCIALFPEFPHPSTGPGPHHLARLTRIQGMAALQESWQCCTGRPLPANVHAGVEHMIREAGPTEG
jgi:tetratricopeptide (TPR) repeat protein